MVASFLIATLIIFILNLLIVLISISNQYENGIEIFQVITLGVVLILITWNIFAIYFN